jgi:putative endonuclease
MKSYFVYIMTSLANKVMYIGVTSNLEKRIFEHKSGAMDGFAKRYHVTKLVYFEHTDNIEAAIIREKQIKSWRRQKKDALVESVNPEWKEIIF